jgi:hypothetical protein
LPFAIKLVVMANTNQFCAKLVLAIAYSILHQSLWYISVIWSSDWALVAPGIILVIYFLTSGLLINWAFLHWFKPV